MEHGWNLEYSAYDKKNLEFIRLSIDMKNHNIDGGNTSLNS